MNTYHPRQLAAPIPYDPTKSSPPPPAVPGSEPIHDGEGWIRSVGARVEVGEIRSAPDNEE